MSEQRPYLIIGLGNPGPKYKENRHNVGFMIVDHLAESARIPIRRVAFRALIGKGSLDGQPAILAKPQTFMNESGKAVAAVMRFYKIPLENLLVVHDDLDLPFGTLRLRPEGSAGGQRGMGSIIKQLNTQAFARLRVGIGRPPGRMDPSDYVLRNFDPPEEELLPEVLHSAVQAVHMFILEGIEGAMNTYNGRVIDSED